ncbi:MAG: DoxX family protein [Bdellovibrionales bacterium]|nr:DoxX family protein [Bdellovibrionales bacterium]
MSALKSKFEKLNNLVMSFGCKLQDPLLFLIRLYWGYQFFLAGKGKFENFERTVGFFTNLGIPMPELNVYLAAGTEMIGGLLLLVGLGARIVSLPLIFTMFIAYITADYEAFINVFSDPKAFTKAAPFTFMLASLIVLAFGPGRWSLDSIICKKAKK